MAIRVGRLAESKEAVVEVGTQTTKARFIRNGIEYRAPATKADVVGRFVDSLGGFTLFQELRVIQQIPAPGTLVAPGTEITLTLIPPEDTRFSLFDKVHVGLSQQTVAVLVGVFQQNPELLTQIQRFAEPEDVPADVRGAVIQAAQRAVDGLVVDEAQADTGFGALFNGFKIATVYK